MRKYHHLHPGEHVFTAVFRHDAPPSEGLLADVQGCPLTHAYELSAGHEYVVFYRDAQAYHAWVKEDSEVLGI